MKIGKLHIVLIWLALLGAIAIGLIALLKSTPQQVVVRLPELYASFDMTKELDRKFQSSNKSALAQSDSLNIRIESLGRKLSNPATYLQAEELELMKINALKNNMDQSMQQNKLQIESQIWNRLNTYLLEYVNDNPYQIILGAKGEGDVLHIDPSVDITNDVLEYANAMYHGS